MKFFQSHIQQGPDVKAPYSFRTPWQHIAGVFHVRRLDQPGPGPAQATSNRDLFLQTIGAAGTIAGIGWAAYERFIGRKNDYAEFIRVLKEQGAERDKLRTERDQARAQLSSEVAQLCLVNMARPRTNVG